MKAQSEYLLKVEKLLEKVRNQSSTELESAAQAIANCLEKGGLIHVFGTGHSHMLAEELFYRAGGLGNVNPILEEDLMLHLSASRSTEIERTRGLAEQILQKQNIGPHDVFILASNSGGNAVIEEMAQAIKGRGHTLIAVTSITHASAAGARANGVKLHQLADIVLDNYGELGDASISIPGLETKVGPTSSVIGTAIVNAISVRAAEILSARGIKPTVFASSNTSAGERHNSDLVEELRKLVKIL